METRFELHVGSRAVVGWEHLPDGRGAPAVVLAPGRGYHMDLPLVRDLCRALPSHGIGAFRFDWSADEAEAQTEEVRAVVRHARAHAAIDATRLALGGKSLGSVLAWRARDDAVAAFALLTPVLRTEADLAAYYDGLEGCDRPTLLLSGRADPLGAAVPSIAGRLGAAATVVQVGGDHGLNATGTDSRFAPLGVALAAAWLAAALREPLPRSGRSPSTGSS